jgi:hypothetical protein
MTELQKIPLKNPSKTQKVTRYFIENINIVKLIPLHEKVHSILIRVNTELRKMDKRDPLFVLRLKEFNQAVLELQKSKWYAEAAGRKLATKYWKKCFFSSKLSLKYGTAIYDAIIDKSSLPVVNLFDQVTKTPDSEILMTDSVPLLPQSNPVVFLEGTDYEMGFQYSQQVIEIFGRWIFMHKAGRSFTIDETEVHRRYEEQMKIHTPELLDFIRGWADGATASGVLMDYEDVLDIWTGHSKPTNFYQAKGDWDKAMDRLPILCSGMAAWGKATIDGKLVTASSGDHDATFMVTIVAFPKTGNSFIYSPFSVYGDVPIVGNVGMMGHPGMNSRGVAYVHHGGVPKMIEDRKEWGYGIRRGMSVFHVLRFANSAHEALEMEMSFPVGDVGLDPANTAGGFYADDSYGYIAESRKNPVAIREAGILGETDFLYANNSAAHPLASESGWMKPFKDKWKWDQHGGWTPLQFQPPSLISLRKPSGAELVNSIQNLMYHNSCSRNNYAFSSLNHKKGSIDQQYMKQIYQTSGILPVGSFEEIAKNYKKTGEWGQVTTGHAGNAIVAFMKPSEGKYAVCVGPAARGLTGHAPFPHCGPIYNETNAVWEMHLGESLQSVLKSMHENAISSLEKAKRLYQDHHDEINDAYANLITESLLLADQAFERGLNTENKSDSQKAGQLSKAARCFNEAQVFSNRTYNLINDYILQ